MDNNYINVIDIYETLDVTNEDVIVTITPFDTTSYYEYIIYKDDNVLDEKNVDTNEKSVIHLTDTGNYKISINLYDANNVLTKYDSGIYKIDKEKPVINLGKRRYEIIQNEALDVEMTASDNYDGDVTSLVTSNIDTINLSKVGTYELSYTVTDRAGNTAKSSSLIVVKPNLSNYLLIFDFGLIFGLLIVLCLILRYLKSMRLEKKISKYSLEPIIDNYDSLLDKFFKFYRNITSKIAKNYSKSVFLTKYSKHFEKYVGTIDNKHSDAMSMIVTKTFIGIIFLIVAIISKSLHSQILSIYEVFIPLTIGFFIPDIIYFTKYKVYRKKIENDFLEAIIIMNNAFKSGRSIMQAIDLVASELEGPISEEFKKMSLEISFGLAVEDVFKRFSKRINLPEVSYLTASLSILNKTGGNIIKVFSSIERTLFNKKKLNLELKSLTGSSKIIVYILFVVPIAFVTFISIIDPSYFLPLITTPLGLIITAVVMVVYVVYIIVVRKIMKVRM